MYFHNNIVSHFLKSSFIMWVYTGSFNRKRSYRSSQCASLKQLWQIKVTPVLRLNLLSSSSRFLHSPLSTRRLTAMMCAWHLLAILKTSTVNRVKTAREVLVSLSLLVKQNSPFENHSCGNCVSEMIAVFNQPWSRNLILLLNCRNKPYE